MTCWFAVALVALFLLTSTGAYRGPVSRRGLRRKLHVNVRSSSSAPDIEPTYYVTDLYGVLGVPRNSSTPELRKAYMKIAFENHPDRNNSAEALNLFRNATFAYQTFKDPQTRRKYDNRDKTEAALSAFEDIITVAVPIASLILHSSIDLTTKAISSYASAVTNAGFDAVAVLAKDEPADAGSIHSSMDGIGRRFKRVSYSFIVSNMEKRKEDLRVRVENNEEAISKTEKQIAKLEQSKEQVQLTVLSSQQENDEQGLKVDAQKDALMEIKDKLAASSEEFNLADSEFNAANSVLVISATNSTILQAKLQTASELVEVLEMQLNEARVNALNIQVQKQNIDKDIVIQEKTQLEKADILGNKKSKKDELIASEVVALESLEDSKGKKKQAQRELDFREDYAKERASEERILNRKLEQQRKKRLALALTVKSVEADALKLVRDKTLPSNTNAGIKNRAGVGSSSSQGFNKMDKTNRTKDKDKEEIDRLYKRRGVRDVEYLEPLADKFMEEEARAAKKRGKGFGF